MSTLLDKAKATIIKRHDKIKYSDELKDLAFAWLENDVKVRQINIVLKRKKDSTYFLVTVARILKDLYQQGKIKIN